jgi:hypothetical protein
MRTLQPSLRHLVLVILLSLPALCQTNTTQPQPDVGKISGAVYSNEFFKIQLNIPAGWSVNGEAAKERVLKAGRDLLKPEDEKTQQGLDESRKRTTQLLIVSKYPMGSAGMNSSFSCVSEQLPPAAQVNTGRDYLTEMSRLFKSSTIPVTVEGGLRTEKLGGVEFDVLDISFQSPNGKIPQRYYAVVSKGYALVFIVTLFNEADRKTTDEILGSIKFAK